MPKFTVSPSRIARYYFHECDRYLRYTSTPKERRAEEGVPARSGPPQRHRQGHPRRRVPVGGADPRRVPGREGHRRHRRRTGRPAHETPPRRPVHHRRPARRHRRAGRLPGDAAGPRLLLRRLRPRPRLRHRRRLLPRPAVGGRAGDGGAEVRVVDAKATDTARLAHRIQVGLYALILDHVLADGGPRRPLLPHPPGRRVALRPARTGVVRPVPHRPAARDVPPPRPRPGPVRPHRGRLLAPVPPLRVVRLVPVVPGGGRHHPATCRSSRPCRPSPSGTWPRPTRRSPPWPTSATSSPGPTPPTSWPAAPPSRAGNGRCASRSTRWSTRPSSPPAPPRWPCPWPSTSWSSSPSRTSRSTARSTATPSAGPKAPTCSARASRPVTRVAPDGDEATIAQLRRDLVARPHGRPRPGRRVEPRPTTSGRTRRPSRSTCSTPTSGTCSSRRCSPPPLDPGRGRGGPVAAVLVPAARTRRRRRPPGRRGVLPRRRRLPGGPRRWWRCP